MALAAFWPLITSHCELESVSGFEFLACLSDGQASADNTGHCDDDRCCLVEDCKFQSPRHQDDLPVCIMALLPFDLLPDVEQSQPLEDSLGVLTAAPPELTASWQFTSRAAPQPRAPSFAS